MSPYKAANGKCARHLLKTVDEVYRVDSYKFIGGAYGKSSERDIMLEMKDNGPVVMSLEPAQDFMYYSSGIYHSVEAA